MERFYKMYWYLHFDTYRHLSIFVQNSTVKLVCRWLKIENNTNEQISCNLFTFGFKKKGMIWFI